MHNIVYLYAELQPSTINVIRELLKIKDVKIFVVHWDNNKLAPYMTPAIKNVVYINRSEFCAGTLYRKIIEINPSIIYTSGWMDGAYLSVCKKIKGNLDIPIIAGSDTKWKGGKQWINVIASPIKHRRCFTHIHVAGIWQYEYARRLGFSESKILMHNLSADVSILERVKIEHKMNNYPRKLLFIGRFYPVKGLKFLVDAWDKIENKNEWVLTLVGSGPEKEMLLKHSAIEVKNFMSQEQLVFEFQDAGCFILPSIEEPWGVVLHEAAAAGLPILSSNICGAVPYFVMNNYNGITFPPGNVEQIKIALEKIINSEDVDLLEMSHNSRKLSQRITPEIVARTLLSVL